MTIANQIENITTLTNELAQVENDYQSVKEEVSLIWKEYFRLNPIKKDLNARRKLLKAELKSHIDNSPELAALLKSIK
jgi:hypothetical protein